MMTDFFRKRGNWNCVWRWQVQELREEAYRELNLHDLWFCRLAPEYYKTWRKV